MAEQQIIDALVAAGIAGVDGSIVNSQAHEVAAVVAPLLAGRRAQEQRLIGELADTRGRLGEAQGLLWEAREHLTLLKWLHAENGWELKNAWSLVFENEADAKANAELAEKRLVAREDWKARCLAADAEIDRLRREVEFEANAERYDHGWMNFSLRPCACLPDGAELPAGWSLPQCSVHLEGSPA